MSGPVWEWRTSPYTPSPSPAEGASDVLASLGDQVLCGEPWLSQLSNAAVATRNHDSPRYALEAGGSHLVRDAGSTPSPWWKCQSAYRAFRSCGSWAAHAPFGR